uniref:Mitochondrial glycoprotein n=1 Tax=Rhabditophanes sp. KR3021 TaxID=114890 RepID=A0AC35TPV6_9BILA
MRGLTLARGCASFLSKSVARNFVASRTIFSTAKCLSVQAELTGALAEEIKAEKDLESKNLSGHSAPVITGFTVTANDAEVKLTKTHGTEKICVILNVNHSVEMGDEESGEASDPVALPPFSIEITKGEERLCFHMELVETEDGKFDYAVEEYYVAPASKNEGDDADASVYASSGRYIDPKLHDLLFVRYLEERGFTQAFCGELVNYATHYEHTRYVSLLSKINEFVGRS